MNNLFVKKNSNEIANMFELSKEDVDKLFMYYESLQPITEKLTINEFVNFTLDKVYTNPEYKGLFTDDTLASLKLLKVLSNKEIINTKMDAEGLAKIFDLSKDDIDGIRISIESDEMGIYKSFNYEIFERRNSVVVAFDGNSPVSNLIQEAKNGKGKAKIYVNSDVDVLKEKAKSLDGYVRLFNTYENLKY